MKFIFSVANISLDPKTPHAGAKARRTHKPSARPPAHPADDGVLAVEFVVLAVAGNPRGGPGGGISVLAVEIAILAVEFAVLAVGKCFDSRGFIYNRFWR